jgi:hypothetical protein
MEAIMSERVNLDHIRSETLARIERSERNLKLSLYGVAVMEALFLGAMLLLTDFSNRLHMLLLLGTVGSYMIIVSSLIVLAQYLNRGNLRILKAIELMKAGLG